MEYFPIVMEITHVKIGMNGMRKIKLVLVEVVYYEMVEGISMSKSGFYINADNSIIYPMVSDGKEFTLKELQSFVGGLIEFAPNNHKLNIIANEEGLLLEKVIPNMIVYQIFGIKLFGDVFVFDTNSLRRYLTKYKPQLKFLFYLEEEE
tara:strand:- start:614 stop:1060 length:447 start_codon:yes stop_codon:yes gene_type:complete